MSSRTLDIHMKSTTNFYQHVEAQTPIVISEGGGRSGKTYSILQSLILIALKEKNQLISVVAESYPFLSRGAMRDFKSIMQKAGMYFDERWAAGSKQYTFHSGTVIEFFTADNVGKAIGAERDYLFINECYNVKYEIAFQLMARTNKRTYLDYNPVSEFWVHTEIMHNPAFDGQWTFLHSTFAMNEELEPSIKKMMLARAAIDENYKRVYVDGLVGSIEGLVFPKIEQGETLPATERIHYGLDFGYTHDPTAVVAFAQDGDAYYFDEVIYETGLRNAEISNRLKGAGVVRTAAIYADSAEPKSIDELALMGWNVHPTVKGKDSIAYGIDLMRSRKIRVTKRSLNLIKEFRNYTYAKDKQGALLNQPVDAWNHAIDACRYVVMSLQRSKQGFKPIITNNSGF